MSNNNNLFQNNKFWIVVLVCVLVFLVLKNPMENFLNNDPLAQKYKIDTSHVCSTDCCSFGDYPISGTQVSPEVVEKLNNGELLRTNMGCDGIHGHGCVCASQNQFNFISSRGNNVGSCTSN